MWRFILISFGFLGFAFYELSGGSDYAPREGSRQDLIAKARLLEEQKATALAEAKPKRVAPQPQRANDAPDDLVVLASVSSATPEPKPAAVTLSQPVVDTVKAAALVAPTQAAEEPAKDIREVTGSSVNIRRGPGTSFQRMGKLKRGDRVEVLRDDGEGWVKLRVEATGRIGYMADFLLTAPLNEEAYASN